MKVSTNTPHNEPMQATREKNGSGTRKFRLKILGVGGAGGNTVRQIAESRESGDYSLHGVDLVALNTDLQDLPSVSGIQNIQLGSMVTHGLGTGGDPELGQRSALQESEQLQLLMQDAEVVFLVAGLGGGTGGGASPVLARLAKDQGALVIAFVVMPFQFEGERRQQQAIASLEQLKAQAGIVICIPNDKLAKIAGEKTNVANAFRQGNELIQTGAKAIWQLLSRKGLINLDFSDVRAAIGARHCEGLFSYGEAKGKMRVAEATISLLSNPTLNEGQALSRSESILISILGGDDLTLADVEQVVSTITKEARRARIIMGAAIDKEYQDRVAITILASTSIGRTIGRRTAQPVQSHLKSGAIPSVAEQQIRANSSSRNGYGDTTVTPSKVSQPKQGTLPLQGISRGRFEKDEPTLYNGENLDVPTFIRRGINLKA